MGNLHKAYCRTFQAVFNIGARCLRWRKAQRIEGAGCIKEIPAILDKCGVRKTLVVTDPGLMKAGVAPKILEVFDNAGVDYVLFDSVEANPSLNTVYKIRDLYLESDCGGFVAIGGGSPMDAAKAAASIIARPEKNLKQLGGLLKVGRKLPPFIAVPTTAGTGSETTIAALITDTDTHHKYAIMDLHLIPLYAVLDPELTTGLPPHVTAATGMDALTHAIEAYLCWTYNTKESIRFAEDAVCQIFKYLERAYRDGNDIEARGKMLFASYQAGFAFTRAGVGNVHAIAHTLGGLYNTAHGLANAVILPIVLEDYGEAVYPKLAHLAVITDTKTDGNEAEKAQAFIAEIRAMNERMGIPTGFDFIKDEDIPQMTKWASKEANPIYPVPVYYTEERYRSVIERIRN